MLSPNFIPFLSSLASKSARFPPPFYNQPSQQTPNQFNIPPVPCPRCAAFSRYFPSPVASFWHVQSNYISKNHNYLLMDKKASKHNEKEKPNWDWAHIECYLKTVEANRKSTIWNLAPSIILTNPSSESSGPNVRLYIDTEKSLQYSNDLGWNWHKSWNIPNISLRLEIKDQSTGDFLLSPRNLYAQIFAVKKNTENEKTDRMTLIDVGIRGQSKMEMIDGQVYFSAIKFSSTTYNNEGINFNLLIVLYINQGEFEKPKVLTAVISPPIFVDSRRSARDYQEKKFSSFVEPFGYDNIEKEFIKRENKSKSESEIVIKNDPEGFYNYITAPNIRHKVKHPVFLAIKFSNCVRIYYNTKLVENSSNVNELLENLQTKLLKENKNKQKTDTQLNANLEEKHFLFAVTNLTDSLKRKKVIESIETMQNEFIGITCSNEELLDIFSPIENMDALKKGYKETYESLVNICQNYEPEYPEESEDEYYSDQYEQSDKSSKKPKKEVNEPVRTSQRNKTSIISNNKGANANEKKEKEKEKAEQTILKKEELFESQFQAPVFFNNQAPDAAPKKNSNSAFSKASGFRNVNENNPIFDTSQLNKAFSNNLGNIDGNDINSNNNNNLGPFLPEPSSKQTIFKQPEKINQNLLIGQNNHLNLGQNPIHSNPNPSPSPNLSLNQGLPQNQAANPAMSNFSIPNLQNMGNMSNQGGFNNSIYDNLMYSNLMLSNWLGSVKSNNNSLYDGMMNHSLVDQLMHKNNIERYLQAEQQQKMMEMGRLPLQNQEQQSIVCLIQQIGLYKELLSQVTYQNQLLSRDITFKQQQNHMNSLNQLKYPHNDLSQFNNMSNNMQGMNYMGGMNPQMGMSGLGGVSNLQNLQNLSNLAGLSGMNSNMMGNNMLNNQVNLNNLINQSRNAENSKEKQPLASANSMASQGNGIKDVNMSMLGNMGGMGGMGGMGNMNLGMSGLSSMGNMGSMGNMSGLNGLGSNYDIIKSMVLQQMKQQAELKERQKQQNSK